MDPQPSITDIELPAVPGPAYADQWTDKGAFSHGEHICVDGFLANASTADAKTDKGALSHGQQV